MTDSLLSRFTHALTAGSACATPVATAAFIGTPGFIADDIVSGATAGVVCGTAGFFGIDIKSAILSGWYGAQPSLIETVKQSAPNILNNTCEAIYSNSTIVPPVFETVTSSAKPISLISDKAFNIAPTLITHASETSVAIYTGLTNSLESAYSNNLPQDILVNTASNAKSIYDAMPYVPYVSEALRAQPILTTLAAYNGYNAIKNGTSVLAAVADTAVRGYALPMIARAGAEMLSNATGGVVSSDMINIPAQMGTQVLYAKAKNAYHYYSLTSAPKQGHTPTVQNLIQIPSSLIGVQNQNHHFNLVHISIQMDMKPESNLDLQNEYGETRLMLAAREGNLDLIKTLIQAGVNLNLQNKHGETALIVAAKNGYTDIVDALIQAGANLDLQDNSARNGGRFERAVGHTALMWAAHHGHIDIVNALLQAGANLNLQQACGSSALNCAAPHGHTAIVNALIQAGAKLDFRGFFDDGTTPLMDALFRNHPDIANALIQAGANLDLQTAYGTTALIIAVCCGYTDIVNVLIQAGANLDLQDEDGETALTDGAKRHYSNPHILKALIQAGAKLDLQDNWGKTVLMTVAERKQTDAVNALIQAGANLNLQDENGDTALILAVKKEDTDTVNALIQAGANLNVQDKNGDTALIWAIKNSDRWKYPIITALIQAGADLTLMNNAGKTALILANERWQNENVTFSLLSAMKLHEITAAIQDYPQLNPVVNRFKAEVLNIKDKMFHTLRALVQNEPMKGNDFSANLVNLPLEMKTVILSHFDYPVWYARKEQDLIRQSYKVSKIIEDRQESDEKAQVAEMKKVRLT